MIITRDKEYENIHARIWLRSLFMHGRCNAIELDEYRLKTCLKVKFTYHHHHLLR